MKNFVKKNMKLLTVLGIVILVSAVGTTLALTLRFGTTSISATTANMVVNVRYEKDGNNNDITSITSNGDLVPISLDTSSLSNVTSATNTIKYKFWVSGSSLNPNSSIYDVSLNNVVVDCELRDTYVKWLLYKNNTLLSSGNLSPSFDTMPNNRLVLTGTQQDLTTTEDEYLFVLYIEESCTGNINTCTVDQSNLLNKNFSASITIDTATKAKKTNTRTTSQEAGCVAGGTSAAKPVCNENLVYDGTAQSLFKSAVATGVTVNQSTATTPGEYTVTAKLSTGYKWSDNTVGDYVFTCKMNKRPVTIASLDQYGFTPTISSSPTYVSSNGLISGHTINSISLNTVGTVDGAAIINPTNAIIYDSGNNNVTNYYNINYQSLGKEILLVLVEYIASTGTQYIDTGFKHNQNTRLLADMDFQPSVAYVTPFGSWGGANTSPQKRFGAQINANNNGINLYYGSRASQAINTPATYTGRKTWDFNKNVFTIGGTSKTFSAQTFQSQFNDYIFGLSSYTGTFYGGANMKLYSFKIYDNGTLVRDFVPCYKKYNGEGGLYDTVNNVFYENKGTGEFQKGPEVSS